MLKFIIYFLKKFNLFLIKFKTKKTTKFKYKDCNPKII